MKDGPHVLMDDDGDLWIDLRGTGDYRYLSPYAALGPASTLAQLRERNPYLSEAQWVSA